jgi:hypothetical protein
MTVNSQSFESLLGECRRAKRNGLVLGWAIHDTMRQYGITNSKLFTKLYWKLMDELPDRELHSPAPRHANEEVWFAL